MAFLAAKAAIPLVASIFSHKSASKKAKASAPQEAPPAVIPDPEELKRNQRRQAAARFGSSGRASTILSDERLGG
jgi:hypothetical protein